MTRHSLPLSVSPSLLSVPVRLCISLVLVRIIVSDHHRCRCIQLQPTASNCACSESVSAGEMFGGIGDALEELQAVAGQSSS